MPPAIPTTQTRAWFPAPVRAAARSSSGPYAREGERCRLSNTVALLFILVGLALFVIGDLMWLVRHTLSRPMNMQVTGGFVAVGVALMVVGLTFFALG
jgi:uncharacterized membrane protein YidH (DUF202 family)